MNVKQNIGIMNALIRITVGLTMLSWATAKLVKRPWRNSYLLIAFLAAMKVGEGIVKYCPMTDVIQNQMNQMMGSDSDSNKNGNESQNKSDLKQMMDMFVPKQKEQSSNGTNNNQHQQGSHHHEQENSQS
ncbi:DUF2892 domain-containing protein [Caldifermentibacillus hisashii]|uniref:YgaP family membrane protein n=1 Tax=Caldifermentibacillus hisashii TaxID=996558 RepID=UPI0034D62676